MIPVKDLKNRKKEEKRRMKLATKAILAFLYDNQGRAFTREEIIEKTCYDPDDLCHTLICPIFPIDYKHEDGHYYAVRDSVKTLLFVVASGVLAIPFFVLDDPALGVLNYLVDYFTLLVTCSIVYAVLYFSYIVKGREYYRQRR